MVDTNSDPSTGETTAAVTPAELIIVSGLSGSGKTVALRTLEDLGYYCVDNLPAALMPAFVQAISQGAAALRHKLAVGVDVRNRAENLNRLPAILAELAQADIAYRLVFIDARDDVLIKRYSETRRRHPLSGEGLGLAEAIATERRLLRPMLSIADRIIDTSDLNVHQLRRLIITEMGLAQGGAHAAVRIVRVSPRRADRRGFRVRRALPAEPALGIAPAPAFGQGRARARMARIENRRDRISRRSHALPRHLAAALRSRRPQLRDDLHRLQPADGIARSILPEQLSEHFRTTHRQVLSYHRELE